MLKILHPSSMQHSGGGGRSVCRSSQKGILFLPQMLDLEARQNLLSCANRRSFNSRREVSFRLSTSMTSSPHSSRNSAIFEPIKPTQPEIKEDVLPTLLVNQMVTPSDPNDNSVRQGVRLPSLFSQYDFPSFASEAKILLSFSIFFKDIFGSLSQIPQYVNRIN